uniref:Bifunctional inhibitor/plant lipid transfer protein/seed storage helical domain-containing protein n=1 Tax=Setaria italica TaxID=4555 RepID=K3ZYF7_SETIT
MASGNAAGLKTATVACILLVLAASMVPTPAKAGCASACVDACTKYAETFCSGFNVASCSTPFPLGKTCQDVVAFQPCVASCYQGCTTGQLAGCIV